MTDFPTSFVSDILDKNANQSQTIQFSQKTGDSLHKTLYLPSGVVPLPSWSRRPSMLRSRRPCRLTTWATRQVPSRPLILLVVALPLVTLPPPICRRDVNLIPVFIVECWEWTAWKYAKVPWTKLLLRHLEVQMGRGQLRWPHHPKRQHRWKCRAGRF